MRKRTHYKRKFVSASTRRERIFLAQRFIKGQFAILTPMLAPAGKHKKPLLQKQVEKKKRDAIRRMRTSTIVHHRTKQKV